MSAPGTTLVTPELAAEWLARNTHNRRLNSDTVAKYARDMVEGRWVFTGDTITFDTNGSLQDGQHRLAAIVKSGVATQFIVVHGLSPEAIYHVDIGRPRSLADQLSLAGYARATDLGATGRLAWAWQHGHLTSGLLHRTSSRVIHSFIEDLGDAIPNAVRIGKSSYDAGFKLIPPASQSAAVWGLLAAENDEEDVVSFFDDLAKMRLGGAGDPKAALMRRLQAAAQSREKIPRHTYVALLVRTWNAVSLGEKLSILRVQVSERAIGIPSIVRAHTGIRVQIGPEAKL